MTKRQENLKEKHGTPNEFAFALYRAADDLFITYEEADKAIEKYNKLWNLKSKRKNK
jgi:hypothetical protein